MFGYLQKGGEGPWIPYLIPEGRDTEGKVVPIIGEEGILRSTRKELPASYTKKEVEKTLAQKYEGPVGEWEIEDGEGNLAVLLAVPGSG